MLTGMQQPNYEPNAWRSPAAAATRGVDGKATRTPGIRYPSRHVIETIGDNVLLFS